jgi:16S rRNA (guanine966-N2)-methyltransferase
MRVIGGSAKGRKLRMVPGDSTRPIMDRVKESLFNILGHDVVDARWLDLFAGTGQVGIEALSRGASSVVFVDSARPAIRTIKANLEHTGLEAAQVLHMDAFTYLRHFSDEPFNLIYVAPPQYQDIWRQVMLLLDEQPAVYLVQTGIVVAQIDPREYRELELARLRIYDRRRYGSTLLCFYEQCEPQ